MKNSWNSIREICEISNPLDWNSSKSELFLESIRTICQFHYEHNHEIKWLYDKYHFNPKNIQSESDLEKLPAIGVTAMKYNLLTSLPHEQSVLKLTSSGTRGQKTQIWFDQESLDRVQRMMDVYLDQEGFISSTPQNYMVFNYHPDHAGDLGTAYTEKNQLRFAPIHKVNFSLEKDSEGQWIYDKEKVYKILQDYAKDSLPLRIFAMPAFLFEFIEFLESQKKEAFHFSPQSWILTGGGWKAAEDKKITREAFRKLCTKWFGILDENQRDAFGMAEHCAPYFQCKEHRFHIPAYNRLLIRDPISYSCLPPGEAGLLELITPFNAMMPTTAILSTDYAMIDPEPCSCGWKSPTFTILGRAGLQKHKGCAIAANEIVKRK